MPRCAPSSVISRLLPLVLLLGACVGAAERDELPIFDAHVHYSSGAWGDYPVAEVKRLFDENGVRWVLVSSSPVAGTQSLLAADPGRVIPAIRPYYGVVGIDNWIGHERSLQYLEAWLGKHRFVAIGEFHVLTERDRDRDFLAGVVALARKHEVLLHVHADAAAVDMLYDIDAEVGILWVHAGMVDPVEVVEATMARYPTLHADLSFREDAIAPGGRLAPRWRALLLRFPDRFLVGSDTYANFQWQAYEDLIRINRNWLAQLPEPARSAIAYRNGLRLFGLKIRE